MGLFTSWGAACAVKPAPVAASAASGCVCAPVSGHVVQLSDVPDEAFSQGMLGRGVGVRGAGSTVFSPVSGIVEADVETKHALLIRTDDGAEVLLHVGLDTVLLHGEGFTCHTEKGARVEAGEAVIEFDRALVDARGLDATVVVTVANPEAFSAVRRSCGDEVEAGAALLRVER